MNFRYFSVAIAALVFSCQPLQSALGQQSKQQSQPKEANETATTTKHRHHNVLLIVADDQGLDLGAYGNKVLKTPNLDRLAARGTIFTQGYATVSSCSPSRSVIYSGLYSHSNGMYGLSHDVHNQHLLPGVKTIPVLLNQEGYATALVGKKHIKPDSALPFDQELVPEKPGKRDVALMAQEAKKFISEHDKEPFLLIVGFSDPHRSSKDFGNDESAAVAPPTRYSAKDVEIPSHLPDLPAVREDLAEYYQSITRLDEGVGFLLEALKSTGKDSDTLIIYVSDNGRPFPGAKTTLYDDGIHLPLMVASPDQKTHGIRNNAMVSWIDIVPTILEWTGTHGPSYSLPGHSVLPVLDESNPSGWDEICASHCFHEINQYYPMRAVRTRKYLYIANLASELPYPLSSDIEHSPSWRAIKETPHAELGKRSLDAFFHRPAEELYDLTKDPEQVNNIAKDKAYERALLEMRARLKQFQVDSHDPWLPGQTSAFAMDEH